MGSMSASDAAPLPRLGEVFFDVRGSSRSMRLSWYSDTGVAVFSIWQGGTCTGTFRLPIEDLSRMVDALQRGPRGAGPPAPDATGLIGLPGGRADSPPAYAEYATGQHISPAADFSHLDVNEQATDPHGTGGYRPPAPSFTPSAPYPEDSYREDRRSREDPLTSPSFRDEARSGRYREPEATVAPSFTPAPSYPDGPSPSYRRDSYREDPLTSPSFRDQGRSAGYRDSNSGPFADDPLASGGYRPSRRDGGDYQDQSYPSGDYPAGYGGDDAGRYRGRRYTDDPFQSNYPDEPRDGSNPYAEPAREPRSHRGRPSRT
jgi:hypothetical protein